MSSSPLVSVVIPTRNRKDLLCRALASVEAQHYEPIEVHVVDDASEVPVVESRNLPLYVHRRDASGGASAARNVGIAAAAGEYITFLDDDDTLSPDAIYNTVKWLEAHPSEAVVSSWHAVVRPDGSTTTFRGPRRCSAAVLRWYDALSALFLVGRRSAVGNALVFDETLSSCEDWDLWVRLAGFGPITLLPQPLYRYHQHLSPRVSRSGDGGATGRRAFLAKHRSSMSSSCIAFHECMIELQAENGKRALRSLLAAPHPSTAALVLMTCVSARIGVRRSDPGLPARLLTAVLREHQQPSLTRIVHENS